MTIANPFKTFTLELPVTFQGQTYNSIGVRRPKVKDLRHITGPGAINDPIGAQNAFLGALAEMPAGVFEEMDLRDADQFTEFADSFTKAERKPAL